MVKLDKPTQEEWFGFWVEDLKKAGYIKQYYTDDSPIVLFDDLKAGKRTLLNQTTYTYDGRIVWTEKAKDIFFTLQSDALKKETKETCYFLAGTYTHPEHGVLYMSLLDVKAPPGSGGKNSSDASFRVKRNWVYQKTQVIVNKVYNYPMARTKPTKAQLKKDPNAQKKYKQAKPYLWMTTFTPERYFFTDKKLDKRSIINWPARTLSEFLSTRLP